MSKKTYYIAISIILLFSIIIRIYGWPNTINDINCDEAMTIINANSIAKNGVDIYGTTYPIYFEAWLYSGQSAFATYLIAFFMKLFGFSLISARLPILIFSIIGIVFTILLVNKMFKNKTINLIVGILLAINPWQILQSVWVLDCNFFPHIMVIAIYCLLSGIENKKDIFLYISMIIFAITLYTYGVALYITPIFLLITAIYLLKEHKISAKKLLFCIMVFLFFAIPIILMTVINLFDLPTINIGKITIQNFEYVTRSNDMLIFAENKLQTLLKNLESLIKILLLQTDGLIWNAFPLFGTIYLISLPICIFGVIMMLIQKKEEKENKLGMVIIFTWLFLGIICGVLINDININRINIIWYALTICTGIGIFNIIETVKYKKITTLFIMILYLINFVGFIIYFDYGAKLIENSFTWSKGLVSAIEYVEEIEQNKEIILSYNVCNTDKKDIFIRYATRGNQNEKNINKQEFYKYYLPNTKMNIDFSTTENEYIIEEFDNDMNLKEKIYVITKQEYGKVNNIFEYESKKYNNYIVLMKK